eukprot:COSAG02_NODE_8224_length_2652_cov_6.520538_2_plen_450_part_00
MLSCSEEGSDTSDPDSCTCFDTSVSDSCTFSATEWTIDGFANAYGTHGALHNICSVASTVSSATSDTEAGFYTDMDDASSWIPSPSVLVKGDAYDGDSEASTVSATTTRAASDDIPSIDFGRIMQTTRMCFATTYRRNTPAGHMLNGVSVQALGSTPTERAVAGPCCPFCTFSIISHSSEMQATTVRLNTMPRRYTPRCNVRKQNRLAAWFSKYGYSGPKYCRACSEVFGSHLLRQAVRGTKSDCSRSHPCDHCNSILSHFECTPEELYTRADLANSAPKTKARKLQQRLNHVEQLPRASSSGAAVDGSSARMNSSKRLRCVGAFSIVASVVGALIVVGEYGTSTSVPLPTKFDPSTRREEAGHWTCPAAPAQDALSKTSSSSALAASVYSAGSCDGKSSAHVFACHVDECESGLLPVGRRLCRCDGCIHAGGALWWMDAAWAGPSSSK